MGTILGTIILIIFLVFFILLFVWIWRKLRKIKTNEGEVNKRWWNWGGLFFSAGGLAQIITKQVDSSDEYIGALILIGSGYFLWEYKVKKNKEKNEK